MFSMRKKTTVDRSFSLMCCARGSNSSAPIPPHKSSQNLHIHNSAINFQKSIALVSGIIRLYLVCKLCLQRFTSEFRCKVELDLREVVLRHLEHVVAVGKEYVPARCVLCHELVLAFLESLKRLLIITLNPTCLV